MPLNWPARNGDIGRGEVGRQMLYVESPRSGYPDGGFLGNLKKHLYIPLPAELTIQFSVKIPNCADFFAGDCNSMRTA